MNKRILIVIGLALVVLVLLGASGIYFFTGTPVYSLYLIRKAVQEGDRDTFFYLFDIEQVVQNAVDRFQKKQPGKKRDRSKITRFLIKAAEPAIKEQIDERLKEPDKIPLTKMSFDSYWYEGGNAHVRLRDSDGSTTVVVMEPIQNRRWKVVDLDLEKAGVDYSDEKFDRDLKDILPSDLPEEHNPDFTIPEFKRYRS